MDVGLRLFFYVPIEECRAICFGKLRQHCPFHLCSPGVTLPRNVAWKGCQGPWQILGHAVWSFLAKTSKSCWAQCPECQRLWSAKNESAGSETSLCNSLRHFYDAFKHLFIWSFLGDETLCRTKCCLYKCKWNVSCQSWFTYRPFRRASTGIFWIKVCFRFWLFTKLCFQEIERFILRTAAVFPQKREQVIFIINNYDVILSVIMVSYKLQAFRLF